jgi:2-phosphosulfolactate phosphatase
MALGVYASLAPKLLDPAELSGRLAVVIDALRASTVMVTALANGAARVMPCLDVAEARAAEAALPAGDVLSGGERGGLKIEGFDLGNSPAEYDGPGVAGKSIVFTTTNGTRALLRCRNAERVLIGSFVNRRSVVGAILDAGLPVHMVCAGTDGLLTAEDVLCAGAIAADVSARLGSEPDDDAAAIACEAWRSCAASGEPLPERLRRTRGGRSLVKLGLADDIDFTARLDHWNLVAEYFPSTGEVLAVRPAPHSVPYGRDQG